MQPFEPTKAAIIVQQAAEDLQQVKGMKFAADQFPADPTPETVKSDWVVYREDTLDAVILVIVITMAALVIGSILMLDSFKGLFWGVNS